MEPAIPGAEEEIVAGEDEPRGEMERVEAKQLASDGQLGRFSGFSSTSSVARACPPDEVAFFAQRVAVFLTSSDERRYGQWEHTSWWDFVPGRATLPGCNHRPC